MPDNAQKPANRASETCVILRSTPSQQKSLREARLPRRRCREAQLAPPQVAQVPKGRIAVSVKAVRLYASPTQTQSHHQLPHPNYQVRNDIFSCTIRCEERQTAADDGRGACTSGSITPPQ